MGSGEMNLGGAYYGEQGHSTLQALLASGTAGAPMLGVVSPHHPITCSGRLRYEPGGMFSCEHAEVPADDARTQFCLDTSMAYLLIELATKNF